MFPSPYTATKWAQSQHPIIRVLAHHLQALGVECVPTPSFPGLIWLLRNCRSIDIVHLHWPEIHYARLGAMVGMRGRVNRIASRFGLYGVMRGLYLPWLFTFVFLCRIFGVRLVWTIHDLYPHPQTIQQHYWADAVARGFLMRSIDALILNCPGALTVATAEFGRPKRAFTASLGGYRNFYPDNVTKEYARRMLGLAPEDRVLLCFGGIRLTRNPLQVAQIVHASSDPHLHLLIAGETGSADASGIRHALETMASVDHRIRCDLHIIPNERIQVYFKACDWVVTPGVQHLTSAVIVLGLDYGCPIVASNFGCSSEMVGDAGFLYDETSPTGLTDALQAALNADADEYRRRAIARARHLDWKWPAIVMMNAYQAVLGYVPQERTP